MNVAVSDACSEVDSQELVRHACLKLRACLGSITHDPGEFGLLQDVEPIVRVAVHEVTDRFLTTAT